MSISKPFDDPKLEAVRTYLARYVANPEPTDRELLIVAADFLSTSATAYPLPGEPSPFEHPEAG